MSTTFRHTVHHFIISQHRTKRRTPVHHRLTDVGNAIVHQGLLLLHFVHGFPFSSRELQSFRLSHIQSFCALSFKVRHQFADGACLLCSIVIERLEHFAKCPLCPLVVAGLAGTHLTTPVEGEADFVELFAIARDVLLRSHCRMLPCLDSILFSRQSIGIVSHRVEHIEATQTLVAGKDIGSNVA